MKCQVIETKSDDSAEFPRLMRHKIWGVVLVTGPGDCSGQVTGVAVEDDIGRTATCLLLHMMTPFHGKVVLES